MKTVIIGFGVLFLAISSVEAEWNRGPVPVFLTDATDQAKEQFYQIITNPQLTQDQKEDLIGKFVAMQPQNIQAAYQEFKKKMDEIKSQFDQTITAQLNALTVDARNALAELNAIEFDDKLNIDQKQAKIQAYFDSLKPSVQDELKKLNPMVASPLIGGQRLPHIGTGANAAGKQKKNWTNMIF